VIRKKETTAVNRRTDDAQKFRDVKGESIMVKQIE